MLSTPGVRDFREDKKDAETVAEGEPSPFDALVDQARFLSHRAAAVQALFAPLRSQSTALLADDALDMDAVYEVMDSLTGA